MDTKGEMQRLGRSWVELLCSAQPNIPMIFTMRCMGQQSHQLSMVIWGPILHVCWWCPVICTTTGTSCALPAITIKHRARGQPMFMSFLVFAYLFVQAAESLGSQCPPCLLPTAHGCFLTIAACSLPIPVPVHPCLLLSSLCLLCLLPAHPHLLSLACHCVLPIYFCSSLPVSSS